MKKFFSILLAVVLVSACMALTVNAESKTFNIPKAVTAPTLDGVINADEWNGALTVEMKKGDSAVFVGAGDLETFQGATFKFMWTEDGIWFAADVKDSTPPSNIPEAGNGSYNAGDGVQFEIFPDGYSGGAVVEEMFFFSYHPKTSDGSAQVGEHFVYGTGGAGENVPEAKIVSKYTGTNYVIEGLIPTAALAKSKSPIKIVSGTKFSMNNVIMDDNGDAQGLYLDNDWSDSANANVYVLSDAQAGLVPVTAVPEVTEAATAETVAESVANTVATPVPQTGDNFTVSILIALAALSSIIISISVISKKRKDMI